MEALKVNLTGLLRYAGREGQLTFILHRLTGLGTLLFLTIHIIDTSWVYFAPSMYLEAVTNIYRNPVFMVGEIGLVFAVMFHGANGLRIALVDMFAPAKWTIPMTRRATVWTLVVALILWLPAAAIMGYNLVFYTFLNVAG